MIREFQPVIQFLIKFAVIYVGFSLLYGVWISSVYPASDSATRIVASQSSFIINVLGQETAVINNVTSPTSSITLDGIEIISIYEGCNGINIAVVFLSFVVSIGPLGRKTLWFCAAGLLMIHIANLARIVALFYVAFRLPGYFYFAHKFIFTASIYLIVFVLWLWWVQRFTLPAIARK